jgi:hypothetical protein
VMPSILVEVYSSEWSANSYWNTRRHTPVDNTIHNHRHDEFQIKYIWVSFGGLHFRII